jgi:hypothetical protein
MWIAALLELIIDVFFSRRITPTEETPSAHPLGPREHPEPIADPVPPTPIAGAPVPVPAEIPADVPAHLMLIMAAMRRLGYRIFDLDDADYNLNIVAIRNPEASLDRYECSLVIFWKYEGAWHSRRWPITTFPGSRYLIEKLLSPKGAAILCPGQYLGVYALDLHGGRYRALCQRNGAVIVYRDGDKDRVFDLEPSTIQQGSFGINVHAAIAPTSSNQGHVAERVYASSAGCLVFQRMADFVEFREYCEKAAKIHGNQFSLTLITEDDLEPATAAPRPAQPVAVSGTAWNPPYATAGVRNKNLLNVKGTGWLYSEGRDSRGHNIFPTYAKGLRAGIITLRTYWTKHQKRSIAAILSRWAPVTDTIGSLPGAPANSPLDYSTFVAKRMQGISPVTQLSLFHEDGRVRDADQLFALVSAMAAYENDAALVLPRAIFDEALSLV